MLKWSTANLYSECSTKKVANDQLNGFCYDNEADGGVINKFLSISTLSHSFKAIALAPL